MGSALSNGLHHRLRHGASEVGDGDIVEYTGFFTVRRCNRGPCHIPRVVAICPSLVGHNLKTHELCFHRESF